MTRNLALPSLIVKHLVIIAIKSIWICSFIKQFVNNGKQTQATRILKWTRAFYQLSLLLIFNDRWVCCLCLHPFVNICALQEIKKIIKERIVPDIHRERNWCHKDFFSVFVKLLMVHFEPKLLGISVFSISGCSSQHCMCFHHVSFTHHF